MDVTSSSESRPRRIDAVDMLRGLVMVLMMLDHTRDFTHNAALLHDPSDLRYTTIPLFFTRWVTHLCAPTFVLLAGTGAYLQRMRGMSRGALSWFLVTRGLWLIVLEFTVINFGASFHLYSSFIGMGQVIWAIGVAMIVLAGLVWLPTAVVGAIGIAILVGHNVLDHVSIAAWGGPGSPAPAARDWLLTVLHQPGMLPLSSHGTPTVFMLYPLLPWLGVMSAGYAFGALYRLPTEERIRWLTRLGLGLLAAFVVLRGINGYGDPQPWSAQRSPAFTALSFMAVQKYPPSLMYVCATLGVSLSLLAWFERRLARGASTWLERAFITYGRVPLFFYLLQWYVAHGIGLVAVWLAGQDYTPLLQNPIMVSRPKGAFGFSLPVVYAFWLLGVSILYYPCRWYAGVKARRKAWWLRYL